ncbi:hypothetical protein [Tateyamaria sp. Alg231-49]|uniref:hypothetical protein n=1 Tax=Tateyamaria sp. Alg231-49 TaxID=1922219 RepID=UPI000D5512C1|nr:hypothetical protein [Tateyamaria sp. Alg231-49]
MRSAGYVSAILTGYAAISFGLVKILWRQFGAHFYWSDHSHEVQASFGLDIVLILGLIVAGLSMISLRYIVPASLTVATICLYEYLYLHDEVHSLPQVMLATGLISGQLITFYLNVLIAIEDGRLRWRGRLID